MSFGPMKFFLNALTLDSKTLHPLFLLIIEIFNYNVHNWLVYSNASVNIMLLSLAKKINEKYDKIDAQIIQLDKTHVHDISELRNVLILLSSDQ